MLTKDQINYFNKNGFLLIKNFFSTEEIEKIRSGVKTVIAREPLNPNARYKVTVGDLASKPELAYLTLHPGMIEVGRDILGSKIVYFGESNVMIGGLSRGFHRDNADRESPDGPDWHMPYQVIKMGVYCQDHANYSGGLKVRYGSHEASDFIPGKYSDKIGRGKIYNIPNKSGDLIVWSFKIAHSANFIRLKIFKNLTLDPRWEYKIPQWLQRPLQKERIVLFNAFGAPGESLDRYVQYYIDRGDFHDHWKKSRYDAELQRQADQLGVEIRRPIPEYGSLYK